MAVVAEVSPDGSCRAFAVVGHRRDSSLTQHEDAK